MSILINIGVYNRKEITALSLQQTFRYKQDAFVQVHNDHSTEYDNAFLSPFCDEVIQLPAKLGIQHLRWHQLREFLKTDYEFLYLTDNDVVHDPEYITILRDLYGKYMLANGQKMPVCIYNTVHHQHPTNEVAQKPDCIFRKTAPGVSMFYDRNMVAKIVAVLDQQGSDPDYAWDYRALEYLGLPWVTSKISYLEHFGADGLHNPSTGQRSDYDRDRALNPTPYLQEIRESVISYLMDYTTTKPNL